MELRFLGTISVPSLSWLSPSGCFDPANRSQSLLENFLLLGLTCANKNMKKKSETKTLEAQIPTFPEHAKRLFREKSAFRMISMKNSWRGNWLEKDDNHRTSPTTAPRQPLLACAPAI